MRIKVSGVALVVAMSGFVSHAVADGNANPATAVTPPVPDGATNSASGATPAMNATATTTATTTTAAVDPKNEIVCRIEPPPLGTRIGRRRICGTRAEWDAMSTEAQRTVRNMQTGAVVNPAKGD